MTELDARGQAYDALAKATADKIDDKALRARLYLVKSGIAFDHAFALSDEDVIAYSIIFGELDGGKWNRETQQWEAQCSTIRNEVTLSVDGEHLARTMRRCHER